jgi:hypothetical protein
MMYVNERSADSICDTALLFLAMNSEYIPSHFGGSDKTAVVFSVACLYMVDAPVDGCSGPAYRSASGDVEMLREAGPRRSRGCEIMARGCRGPAQTFLLNNSTTFRLNKTDSRVSFSCLISFKKNIFWIPVNMQLIMHPLSPPF